MKDLSFEYNIKVKTVKIIYNASNRKKQFEDINKKRVQHGLRALPRSFLKELNSIKDTKSVLDIEVGENEVTDFLEEEKIEFESYGGPINYEYELKVHRQQEARKEGKVKSDRRKQFNKDRDKSRKEKRISKSSKYVERSFQDMSGSAIDAYRKIAAKKADKNVGSTRLKKRNAKSKGSHGAVSSLYTKAERLEFRQEQKAKKDEKRERRRQRRQKPLEVTTESLGLTSLDDVSELLMYLKALFPDIGHRMFTSFAVYFVQLYRDSTVPGFILASTQLANVLNIVPADVLDQVKQAAKHIKHFFVKKEVASESLSDDLSSFLQISRSIISCSFAQAMSKVIVSMASLHFFSKDFSKTLYSTFGRPGKMTLIEVYTTILESIIQLIKFGEHVARGDDIKSIIMAEDPTSALILEIDYIMSHSHRLYAGLPVEGYMNKTEFMRRAKHAIELGKELEEKITFGASISALRPRLRSLEDFYYREYNALVASYRATPCAILVTGLPGVGKSSIVEILYRIYCEVRGLEYSPDLVYSRVTSSNYWEGYVPLSHIIVHYSEIGNKHPKRVLAQGDAVIEELCSVVDNLPLNLDAAFEDKGKLKCAVELMVGDTNNPGLNAKEAGSNPAATLRRFHFVDVSVKHKYRMTNSHQLDHTKVPQGEMDLWNFVCYRKFADSEKESSTRERVEFTSLFSFIEHLKELFTDHIRHVNKLRETRSTLQDDLKKYCDSQLLRELDEDPDTRLERRAYRPRKRWKIKPASTVPALEDGDYTLSGDEEESRNQRRINGMSTDEFEEKYEIKEDLCVETESLTETFQVTKSVIIDGMKKLLKDSFFWVLGIFCSLALDLIFEVKPLNFLVLSLIVWILIPFFTWSGICALSVFFLASFQFSKVSVGKVLVTKARSRVTSYAREKAHAVKVRLGSSMNPYLSRRYFLYGASAIGGAFLLLKLLRKTSRLVSSESHSAFTEKDEVAERLQRQEEKLGCELSAKRMKGKQHEVWNVRKSMNAPLFTGDLSELTVKVYRNSRRVRVHHSGGCTNTYILGVKGDMCVINRHALGVFDAPVKLSVSPHGVSGANVLEWRDTYIEPNYVCNLGNDVVVCRLNGVRFKDITKHFGLNHSFNVSLDALILDSNVVAKYKTEPITLVNPHAPRLTIKEAWVYHWPDHKLGYCGLPLLVKRGKGAIIGGIHTGSAGDKSFSSPITRERVLRAIKYLDSHGPYTEVFSEGHVVLGNMLEDPIPKSPFFYENMQGVDYFGKVPGPVLINNTSKLKESSYWVGVKPILERFLPPQNSFYGPPLMKPLQRNGEYISPWNIALRKLGKSTKPLHDRFINLVVDELTDRICTLLGQRGVSLLSPLTIDEAINGAVQDQFLRRINASTSSGFGYEGKKSNHLQLVGEERREPTARVKEDIEAVMQAFDRKESVHFVYQAQLKDEPRSIEKISSGKTRVFYMSPIVSLIVTRMFLAPFYTLMVQYGDIFCTAVGINMHTQADSLLKRLRNFSDLALAGDYGNYDQGMPIQIGKAVNSVVFRVLRAKGYNRFALEQVKGVLTENLYPLVCMNGDLFERPALQPSGKYATAEDNSLRNLVLLMYSYYAMGHTPGTFFDNVLPVTYGDDVIAAVKENVSNSFNNVSFASVVNNHLGMSYTTADKQVVVDKFDSYDTLTFLKRSFQYREDLGRVVAPLDHNSVYKAMRWELPSSSLTPREQFHATCVSMTWELFFHLEEKDHSEWRDLLSEYLLDTGFDADDVKKIPEFSRILATINDSVLDTPDATETTVISESLTNHEEESYLTRFPIFSLLKENKDGGSGVLGDYAVSEYNSIIRHAKSLTLRELREQLEDRRIEILTELDQKQDPFFEMGARILRRTIILSDKQQWRIAKTYRLKLLCELSDIEQTLDSVDRMMENIRYPVVFSESEVVGEMKSGLVHEESKAENMVDVVGRSEDVREAGCSVGYRDGFVEQLSVSDFFHRPVQLTEFTLDELTDLSLELDVWNLYTLNPAVRSKLRNYAYLRANLHVRVAVSGTPFHYGRLLVSYQPFPDENETLNALVSNLSLEAQWRPLVLNYLSQAEGSRTIDVKANQPVDLVCPFLATKSMHRLFNGASTVISDVTPYDDLENAGSIFLYTLNQVKATSSTPSEVSIIVYAWLEDVNLGTNTATQITVTTESMFEDEDERKVGPVERVASRVLSAIDIAAMVPSFQPMATASKMFVTGIRDVSAIFGFSKPTMNSEPMVMKPLSIQNGATTIGYDTPLKITLDPRQEITVDPRVMGCDKDEMVITEVSSRESYLTTFNWNDDSKQLSDPIFCCAVTPMLCTHFLSVSPPTVFYQPTAMAFAAQPFGYWRGDIIFRFDIVCSSFHRGKIAFYYEPNTTQSVLINSAIALNKQFMKVIDIQQTQSVEFCIEWAFPRPWAQRDTNSLIQTNYGSATLPTSGSRYWNGYIAVVPFTDLQSPDDSDVAINVHVRCENLQVNYLTESGLPTYREVETESETVNEVPVTCLSLNDSSATTEGICERYFGEQPLSFRGLLHRYVTTGVVSVGADATVKKTVAITRPILPVNRLPYGVSLQSISLFEYLMLAYVGMRGGIKKRFRFWGLNGDSNDSVCRVSLANVERNVSATASISASFDYARVNGSSDVVLGVTGMAEVELPFYTNNLFVYAFNDVPYGTSGNGMDEYWVQRFSLRRDFNAANAAFTVEEITATADDFSFLRFQGAPYYSHPA